MTSLTLFESCIKSDLKVLNRKEIAYFAWICAVRSLPFLGAKGNFNHWKKREKEKFFCAIFYALDMYHLSIISPNKNTSNESLYYSDLVKTAANAAANNSRSTMNVAAADAATAISYAADAAYAYAADDAAYLSYSINAAVAAASAAKSYEIDLTSIILQDITDISTGNKLNCHLNIYGDTWNFFLNALNKEKYQYWQSLYENLFKSEFVINEISWQRRINVPKEIREQGVSTVTNYLGDLEKGAEFFNEARIIILGDKGVGKTCLARKLVDSDSPMTNENESTAGVSTNTWKLKKTDINTETDINVHIWDFAGHTITHAVHQFFLSERCLYILVYDGRSEERNRLRYWLNHMKNYGGESKTFILVNRRDQHTPVIPVNSLLEQYNIDENISIFSIKDDKIDLESFRDKVKNYIKYNPSWNNLEIPIKYFIIKNILECKFADGAETITIDELKKIATKYKVNKLEELLNNLHALGVCLRYQDMGEFNTLVLNPEWISHGVYKIINWIHENGKYSISINDFKIVFQDEKQRYPTDKHLFIFKLMMRYELAYEAKEGGILIVPHLLHEDRPEILPNFPIGESLMIRYKSEMELLPNTISRFIVRHNEDIKTDGNTYLVWRYGVILDDKMGNIALIREEDRTVSVSVTGKDKTAYLNKLRHTLNEIFDSYKIKKPELQYRVIEYGEIRQKESDRATLWLSGDSILSYSNDNVPYYEHKTKRYIQLQPTVINYNINSSNIFGSNSNYIDKSVGTQHIYNFNNCRLLLQGDLNELTDLLKRNGEAEYADEIKNIAETLETTRTCDTPEEVIKKNIPKKIKRVLDELSNEDSKLHKVVKGIKHGVDVVQDIATGYNEIAQWVGLPQIPKPFLRKE